MRYWYGMLEDAETHFEPASTSYGSYDMTGFPMHDLTFLSNPTLSLALCLGAIPFLTLRRGLGALVTLHLPWKLHHISLLGLELAIRLGYQTRYE